MQFVCPLIVVNDMDVSRNFYEKTLGQKVKYDFGENITFEGDFAIHLRSHFARLIQVREQDILRKSCNSELYFEEEDLDGLLERLQKIENLEYVHGLKEQPWGQRVIRFYDPDMHMIEIGEPMERVAKRFLKQGLSVEDTAQRISMPDEFVRRCLAD